MPIYYPPLSPTANGNEIGLVIGGDVFGRRVDLGLLRHPAVQSVYGLNTGSSTPDSADNLNAVKAYRPQVMDLNGLQLASLRSFLGFTATSTTADDASLILATQVFGA